MVHMEGSENRLKIAADALLKKWKLPEWVDNFELQQDYTEWSYRHGDQIVSNW